MSVEPIAGDPGQVEDLAGRLSRFATGLGLAAIELRAVRTGRWIGGGADAFRRLLDIQPRRFTTTADAFGTAAAALRGYAVVLREVQADADAASTRHQAGDVQGAQRQVADARDRLDDAARRVARILHDLAGSAPNRRAVDGGAHDMVGQLGEGGWHATQDAGRATWALTGAVITDRKQFAQAWIGLTKLAEGDPAAAQAFAKGFIDWDEWGGSPFRALGYTATNVGLLYGGEEVAAARIASATAKAAQIPDDTALWLSRIDPPAETKVPIRRGLSKDARFTQRNYRFTFSDEGRLHGFPISWVAQQLRSGLLTPEMLPVEIIRRNGHELIMNTRSATALARGGIPRNEWVIHDYTGAPKAERDITDRLRRNRLDDSGIASVKERRGLLPEEIGSMPPYNPRGTIHAE